MWCGLTMGKMLILLEYFSYMIVTIIAEDRIGKPTGSFPNVPKTWVDEFTSACRTWLYRNQISKQFLGYSAALES